MTDQTNDRPTESPGSALLRLVDPRLPLPWLIAAIVVASGVYFKVQTLTEAVVDLQITVRTGNQSYTTLAGEQALTKFRVNNTEDDVKALKAAVLVLQQARR
jgi:hypothetical protein